MNFDKFTKAVASIPAGRFFKICYCTPLPLKAAYKNKGWKIFKYTFRVTRTGVDYKALKMDYTDEIKNQHRNSRWVVKNKIKYNANTGKNYLIIAPMKHGEHKSYTYKIIKPDGSYVLSYKYDPGMVINSYTSGSNGPVRNIAFENIEYIAYGGKVRYAANDSIGIC